MNWVVEPHRFADDGAQYYVQRDHRLVEAREVGILPGLLRNRFVECDFESGGAFDDLDRDVGFDLERPFPPAHVSPRVHRVGRGVQVDHQVQLGIPDRRRERQLQFARVAGGQIEPLLID